MVDKLVDGIGHSYVQASSAIFLCSDVWIAQRRRETSPRHVEWTGSRWPNI
jgi:ribosomal protein L24E